jgi:hypothetical protein
MLYPISAFNSITSFASNTTPDERGLRFQVPFACEMDLAWVGIDVDANCDIKLYDASDVVLKTWNLDSDRRFATNWYIGYLPTDPIALAANVTYRLTALPTTTTNVAFRDFDVSTNAHLGGIEGGIEMYHTQRTDAGAWTDTTTKRPWMGIRISGVDTGSVAGDSYQFLTQSPAIITPRSVAGY